MQLGWLWELHPFVGNKKNFSRLAKLQRGPVQLRGLVGAERDLEDYMGIPDTNVMAAVHVHQGQDHSCELRYKSHFPIAAFFTPL